MSTNSSFFGDNPSPTELENLDALVAQADADAAAAATSATAAATSASNAAATLANALVKANNLSDVASVATSRTNLGLGTAATHPSTDFLLAANNLSDVTAATARTNLSAAKSGANSDITSLTGLTTPLSTAQGGTGLTQAIAVGHCRLVLSGGNLVLQPYNGNLLRINGVDCTIPAAGVSLAATSLTPGTVYFIYALATSGVVTSLEASTTTHATSSTSGNIGTEIKSGDDTRTLVGMASPVTGPAWVDSTTQRFVLSWFNRRARKLVGAFTTNRTTSSASAVEINSEIRVNFLVWADDPSIEVGANVSVFSSTTQTLETGIGIDGTTTDSNTLTQSTNWETATLSETRDGLSEGTLHYATLVGWNVTAGTGTWSGGSVTGSACKVVGRVTI
jgi:hypothetical protein